MVTAVFEPDGARYVPTVMARGPWDPGSCHGGAPAALLAHLIDDLPSPAPMSIVRLSYEILRPVPIAPLGVEVRVTRDRRRTQLAIATITTSDATEVMRCSALRLRVGDEDVPAEADDAAPPPEAGPDSVSRLEPDEVAWDTGFHVAMDVRMVEGRLGVAGPGTAWFRFALPLLPDEAPSPVARVAAAADFGNGIGSPLSWHEHLFVNPDLTIALHRPPADEWVALRSASVARATGIGLTHTTLYDRSGRIGTALQSLFVTGR